MTKTLDILATDLAADVRMSQTSGGGYAPTAPVLANRAFGRVEETVRALLTEASPKHWMERSYEYKGVTFHVGHRSLIGDAYDAEIERLAAVLKTNGYKVRVFPRNKAQGHQPALYVTLDKKIGEDAIAVHLDYLRLLAKQEGVHLPGWAKDQITKESAA